MAHSEPASWRTTRESSGLVESFYHRLSVDGTNPYPESIELNRDLQRHTVASTATAMDIHSVLNHSITLDQLRTTIREEAADQCVWLNTRLTQLQQEIQTSNRYDLHQAGDRIIQHHNSNTQVIATKTSTSSNGVRPIFKHLLQQHSSSHNPTTTQFH